MRLQYQFFPTHIHAHSLYIKPREFSCRKLGLYPSAILPSQTFVASYATHAVQHIPELAASAVNNALINIGAAVHSTPSLFEAELGRANKCRDHAKGEEIRRWRPRSWERLMANLYDRFRFFP